MILHRQPTVHLAYCLNVHPGETWEANLKALRTYALAVRDRVAPGGAFGLGLRLARPAVDALRDAGRREELRRFLREQDLYVFTINAFPYGAFHGAPVKERVYAPDWRSPRRLEYTLRLAELLADLLPAETSGSISTVPGSYRAWMKSPDDHDALVGNLAACVAGLERIEARTGRQIQLALEPEPDGLIDTTSGTVEFFNATLARHPAMKAAGANWRRYLGVCLDACHLSVQFEEPADSLRTLHQNGIAVPKVHLSAALRAPCGPAAAARLAAFAEPTYLHQVRLRRSDGRLQGWTDLTDAALAAVARARDGEVRVHMHVPLYCGACQGLQSTASDLSGRWFQALRETGIRHLEIETYTFNVLPRALASLPVEESIAREYRWVLERAGRDGSG